MTRFNQPSTTPHTPLGVELLECRLVPAALDLTARGADGFIGDGYFQQYDARPTGTGKIDSFLRIQGASSKNVVQQGFNTSSRPLQFDENKSPNFTRDLKASELPVVTIGGVNYREFLLDINQKSSQPYLSLDALKVFVTAAGGQKGFDVLTGTLNGQAAVYDLDAAGDNWVKLDYRLNTGSGSGDMLFYLPDAAIAGGQYVTVYSKFGEHYASNAGFQEWAVGVGGSVNSANTGGISGNVFFDADRDGVRGDVATEYGFANVIVYLDANGNGQFDEGVEVYDITDGEGKYSFNQLMAGAEFGYTVRVAVPPLTIQTTANPDPIFLAPGDFLTDVDFGYNTPPA